MVKHKVSILILAIALASSFNASAMQALWHILQNPAAINVATGFVASGALFKKLQDHISNHHKAKLEASNQEIEQIKQDITLMKGNIEKFSTQIKSNTTETQELAVTIGTIEEQVIEASKEHDKLTEAKNTLEQQLKALEKKGKDSEETVTELYAQKEELTHTIKLIQAEIRGLGATVEEHHNAFMKELNECKEETGKCTQEINRVSTMASDATQQSAELEKKAGKELANTRESIINTFTVEYHKHHEQTTNAINNELLKRNQAYYQADLNNKLAIEDFFNTMDKFSVKMKTKLDEHDEKIGRLKTAVQHVKGHLIEDHKQLADTEK